MQLTAKDAISRHMQWRITLQTAATLREPLPAKQRREIQDQRSCLIGRWLASPQMVAEKTRPVLMEMVALHIAFHQQMELVADMLERGRFEDAVRALSGNSPFNLAGTKLALAITSLGNEIPELLASATKKANPFASDDEDPIDLRF